MPIAEITVAAEWDDEAEVWFATSEDIDGLAVEAATLESLHAKVREAVSDLIELNRLELDQPQVPIHLRAQRTSMVSEACA